MTYCTWCGAQGPAQPCPQCGHEGLTDTPPSNEPCAYCGARPTWPVVWGIGTESPTTLYLCAACDDAERRALDGD